LVGKSGFEITAALVWLEAGALSSEIADSENGLVVNCSASIELMDAERANGARIVRLPDVMYLKVVSPASLTPISIADLLAELDKLESIGAL
jgi:hypothetical protein